MTVLSASGVQSSIMANKISDKESAKAILSGIKKEMAKPRIAKSAREAKPENLSVFPLSGSASPELARPASRPYRLVTHPGASKARLRNY